LSGFLWVQIDSKTNCTTEKPTKKLTGFPWVQIDSKQIAQQKSPQKRQWKVSHSIFGNNTNKNESLRMLLKKLCPVDVSLGW
jgi:hypothetical protein